MQYLIIDIEQLPHAKGLDLPSYQTAGAAGADLQAALLEEDELVLQPGERFLVPTGLIMQIPHGYEGQIRPRSGLALKYGITCLNAPGTIDSDYRGEIKVLLVNFSQEAFTISRGMRIAQIVFAPVVQANLQLGNGLSVTERGTQGFGSTGYSSSR